MLIFSFTIIFLLLLSSCISEIKEADKELGIRPIPEVCCMQTLIANIEKADSIKSTRGWGGELGPYDQFPTISYPLNVMYLMVENEDGEWEHMPIPIIKEGQRNYIDICFRADENDYYNIYAMSDGQSIQIGPDRRCFFSSIPEIDTGLKQSPTITTPNGTPTYEPYGDLLFRSDYISFAYEEAENKIYSTWENEDNYDPIDMLEEIQMNRGTSVIIPRLLICDNYPRWEDGLPVFSGSSELTKPVFEERLGSLENWKVHFFLAAKRNQKPSNKDYNYPLELNLDQFSYGPNGAIIGSIPSTTSKGIVSLSENTQPMDSVKQTLSNNQTGKDYTYKGFGLHDGSFPFLYGIKNFNKMDICCSIYYTDPQNAQNNKTITLRFPVEDRSLTINEIHTITYIIDVDDVKKEFFPTSPQKQTKSLLQTIDNDFGKMANMPTLIFKDEEILKIPNISHE